MPQLLAEHPVRYNDPYPFGMSLVGQLLCAVASQSGVSFQPEYLRPTPHEAFYKGFSGMIEDLEINLVAVPVKRHKPDLSLYGFVPLLATNIHRVRPRSKPGYDVVVPDRIEMTYGLGIRSNVQDRPRRSGPYLDAQHGIGLVYDNWLVAVAGLVAAPRRPLTIVQIQNVSGARPGTPGFKKAGLANGLLWRRTLVAATEKVARSCGYSNVAIQSHKKNSWLVVRSSDAGKVAYDDVAAQAGYEMQNGIWVKSI